jgi:hypothetical protein
MEVSESCLYGIYCVQMFYALGCTCTYRITRKNCTYVCMQDGLELTVSACRQSQLALGIEWASGTVYH